MNRSEHLQWSKDRDIAYIDQGDNNKAFASFMSDMGKHPETQNHLALELGMSLILGGQLSTGSQMKNWIVGFN